MTATIDDTPTQSNAFVTYHSSSHLGLGVRPLIDSADAPNAYD